MPQLHFTPRISRPNRKALMTESQKKVALLIGAALIIVPIAVIRTRSAVRGDRRSINWEEKMKVSVEAKAPDWYHSAKCCHHYPAPPSLPRIRLATIRMWGSLESHDNIIRQEDVDYRPIRLALYEMGANGSVIEGVDDRVPGIEPGHGEIIQAAYMIHAGKVPASYVRGPRPEFCLVQDTIPGSAAEEGGLRAGDLFWDVDHRSVLRENTGDCEAILAALGRVSVGSTVTVSVLRDGSPLDLTLKRRDGLYGYHYLAVPLLDSEKI